MTRTRATHSSRVRQQAAARARAYVRVRAGTGGASLAGVVTPQPMPSPTPGLRRAAPLHSGNAGRHRGTATKLPQKNKTVRSEQAAMSALGSGRACSPRLSSPTVRRWSLPVLSGPPMVKLRSAQPSPACHNMPPPPHTPIDPDDVAYFARLLLHPVTRGPNTHTRARTRTLHTARTHAHTQHLSSRWTGQNRDRTGTHHRKPQ